MRAAFRAPLLLENCDKKSLNFEAPLMGPLSVPHIMAKLLIPTIGINSLAVKVGPLSVPIRGVVF